MKKLIIFTTAAMFAFAPAALAGDDCKSLLTQVDEAMKTSQVSDAAKAQAAELREKGADQTAANDKACSATLKQALAALQQ